MTIRDAITRVDAQKYNSYTDAEKIDWLSRLDAAVKAQIIDTHEGGEDIPFSGYNAGTPGTTELLVPAPYDEVYLRWLESQIDYHNGEFDRYNASIILYNSAFSEYSAAYNSNHMPIQKAKRLYF